MFFVSLLLGGLFRLNPISFLFCSVNLLREFSRAHCFLDVYVMWRGSCYLLRGFWASRQRSPLEFNCLLVYVEKLTALPHWSGIEPTLEGSHGLGPRNAMIFCLWANKNTNIFLFILFFLLVSPLGIGKWTNEHIKKYQEKIQDSCTCFKYCEMCCACFRTPFNLRMLITEIQWWILR